MSEKRYEIVNETYNRLTQLLCLVGAKLEYFKYFIKDTKENKYLTISDTIDLLNEQQSLITALEKEHKRAENQIKLLNKQLSKIPPNIRKVWLYD